MDLIGNLANTDNLANFDILGLFETIWDLFQIPEDFSFKNNILCQGFIIGLISTSLSGRAIGSIIIIIYARPNSEHQFLHWCRKILFSLVSQIF